MKRVKDKSLNEVDLIVRNEIDAVRSSLLREFTRLKLTATTEIKELLSEFNRFAYGLSLHTAFTEMLDWMLLPFKRHDAADEQRNALEKYQSHPKVEHLVKLVTLIGELSERFRDPFGELFMQAIFNGHNLKQPNEESKLNSTIF